MRVTATDLWLTQRLLLLGLASWIWPMHRLAALSPAIGRLIGAHRARGDYAEEAALQVLSSHFPEKRIRAIVADWRDRRREASMQMLGLNWPARAWSPALRLHGGQHITDTHAQGRGVILWVSDFVFSSLITKMALHRAGFAVSHLSRPEHGFSTSRFGVRFLNPLWVRVEARYLTERIVIGEGGGKAALQILQQRLAANGIVSITVGDEGRRTAKAPLLDGAVRLATGPAHLSRITRAPLLPVFTLRAADGGYDIRVEPPLATESGDLALAVGAYAARLAPYLLANPEQWNNWDRTVVLRGSKHLPQP